MIVIPVAKAIMAALSINVLTGLAIAGLIFSAAIAYWLGD